MDTIIDFYYVADFLRLQRLDAERLPRAPYAIHSRADRCVGVD